MSGDGVGTTAPPAWVTILWLSVLALAVRIGVTFVTGSSLRPWEIAWDLIGMVLLLVATFWRFPDQMVAVGLMWAISPLVWPASSVADVGDLIAAAAVSLAVLLLFLHKRTTAVLVCVVAMFAVEMLLAPVLLAVLCTARPGTRARMWASAAAALVAAAAVTWAAFGLDQLGEQVGIDRLGATLPEIAVATASLVVVLWIWSRRRVEGYLDGPTLAAALLLAAFALPAISNPELLCLAAPAAIVACIGLGSLHQWILLVLASGAAWASEIVATAHDVLAVAFVCLTLLLVWNYLTGRDRLLRKSSSSPGDPLTR